MKTKYLAALGVIVLLAGCGPTAEEQHAMDQQRCSGFGFAPGTDAFAHCMMSASQQREAQDAADRRAAADRDAANQRTQAAIQAAKDKADQDAWDRRTGQGAYAHSSSVPTGPVPISNPTSNSDGFSTQGMHCTTTSNSSGSANNQTTTSQTTCHN